MEVLMKVSQSELDRHRFLERQRVERDAASDAVYYREIDENFRAAQEELRAAQERARAGQEELRAVQERARAQEEELRAVQERARTQEEKVRAREEELRAIQERTRVAKEQAKLARQVGYDEGVAKASEINKLIIRIQLLQQLLKQPDTSSDDLGRMAEANLRQLEDSLKQQLSVPKGANGSGSPVTA
jgi:hypothetical protein